MNNNIVKFTSKEKKQDLCSITDFIKLTKKQNKKSCKGTCKINIKSPHLPYPAKKQEQQQPEKPLPWLEKFATLHFDNKNEMLQYHHEGAREGKVCNMMIHRGQRKLFLSELRFLLTYAQPNDKIVYVGSAPGLHTHYLNSLFKDLNLKWELWDPNPFSQNLIRDKNNFTIHQKYMTTEEIEKWKKEHRNWKKDFLLISDLRSTEGLSGKEHDEQLLKDNALQEAMVRTWKPRVSMLKFRFPYPDESNKHTKTKALDGDVWFQSFPNQKSTESRLIVKRPEGRKKFAEREYDWTDWEEYFFYHNAVKRRINFGCAEQFNKIYDGCFDCQSEIRQWQLYVDKYHDGLQTKIIELAIELNKHVGNLKYTGIWCSLIQQNTICPEIVNDNNNKKMNQRTNKSISSK